MPGGFVLIGGGWSKDAIASNVLGVKVATFRTNHDWHVADGDAGFGWRTYAVTLDGEVDGYWRHVGQLAKSALHGR